MAGRGAGLMLFWRPSVDGEGEEGMTAFIGQNYFAFLIDDSQ